MSYVESVLNPSECVVGVGRISLFSLLGEIISMLFGLSAVGLISHQFKGTILLIAIGIAFCVFVGVLAQILIQYYGTEIGVTNRRVIVRKGLVLREVVEMRLENIESVKLTQTLVGRLFGYGTIELSGFGTTHAILHGLADAYKIQSLITSEQQPHDKKHSKR